MIFILKSHPFVRARQLTFFVIDWRLFVSWKLWHESSFLPCMERANSIAGRTRTGRFLSKVFSCIGNSVSVAKWAFCCLLLSQSAFAVTTLSTFQAGAGGWHMGTLAVGNLDSDAALEIVVPY